MGMNWNYIEVLLTTLMWEWNMYLWQSSGIFCGDRRGIPRRDTGTLPIINHPDRALLGWQGSVWVWQWASQVGIQALTMVMYIPQISSSTAPQSGERWYRDLTNNQGFLPIFFRRFLWVILGLMFRLTKIGRCSHGEINPDVHGI